MTRLGVVSIASLLFAGAFAVFGSPSSRAADEPAAKRLLVTVKTGLATSIEAALPGGTMRITSSADPAVQGFLARHPVQALRPLYPWIVRDKKRGAAALPRAASVRQKFKARALRAPGPFAPPDLSRTYVLELPRVSEGELERRLAALRADPEVESAEKDQKVSLTFVPNDRYFSTAGSWGQSFDDLWGLKKIGAPLAWDTTAGEGMVVAVIDTGVDYNHPDIASNIWTNPGEIAGNGQDDDGNGLIDDVRGWDFFTWQNDPMDHHGHGTHVAGTIAATGDNGVGVVGVAWKAKVMVVKGLGPQGEGNFSALAEALVYATDMGADVINNSWAGPAPSPVIAAAVSYAHSQGAVIVAGAGNNDADARGYVPAALAKAVTVGAADRFDRKSWFSNHGPKIDVAAPGEDILSLRAAGNTQGPVVDQDYLVLYGTSMATPHVSGLAALILAQHPTYTNEEVRQVLRASARDAGAPGQDRDFGHGRIDARAALALVGPLEAKITSPESGLSIDAPIAIRGTANGSTFASYVLEYGPGEWPNAWTPFGAGRTPVRGGTLGRFDPAGVPDGLYTLRLTALNSAGASFTDRVSVVVDCVSIDEPVPAFVPAAATTFRPGQPIPIMGRATGGSFQGFVVDWARGVDATSGWSSADVALVEGGRMPVPGGALATWTPSGITRADYYTIRLRVKNATFASEARTTVYLEPDLLPGRWPQVLEVSPASPGTASVSRNADGSARFFVELPTLFEREELAAFRTFSPKGTVLSNFPLPFTGYGKPAAGDLVGDKGEEVVAIESRALRIFRPDHTSYDARPYGINSVGFHAAVPLLEDMDGDGRLEIIAVGLAFGKQLFVWHGDGTPFGRRFPQAFEGENPWIGEFGGDRVLAVDLDGNGRKELLVLAGPTFTSTKIRRFDWDGTPLPFEHPPFGRNVHGFAAADLDGDGRVEIVILTGDGNLSEVHVLRADGSEKPGWPRVEDFNCLALGDLDGDGAVEVVAGGGSAFMVWSHDGAPFSPAWPKWELDGAIHSLALADVDSDGRPDIVTDHQPYPDADPARSNLVELRAYRAGDGALIRSWNLTGTAGQVPTVGLKPFVGDFDGDGRVDIAGTYPTIRPTFEGPRNDRGVFTVLTTGGLYKPAAVPWPMMHRDARNSNVIPPTVVRHETVPPVVRLTAPADGATVDGTVTIRAEASDNVAVRRVEFYVDGRWIGSDAAAPYSVSWDTRNPRSSAPSRTLVAKAYDTSGNVTASTPVVVVSRRP